MVSSRIFFLRKHTSSDFPNVSIYKWSAEHFKIFMVGTNSHEFQPNFFACLIFNLFTFFKMNLTHPAIQILVILLALMSLAAYLFIFLWELLVQLHQQFLWLDASYGLFFVFIHLLFGRAIQLLGGIFAKDQSTMLLSRLMEYIWQPLVEMVSSSYCPLWCD